MASRYSATVNEHFARPRNLGRLPGANGRGVVGDLGHTPVHIEMAILVDRGVVASARFRAFGCAATIAASSMITQLALDQSLAFAKALTPEHVTSALGGLPPDRMYAPGLALEALHSAVADYEATAAQPVAASSTPIPNDEMPLS